MEVRKDRVNILLVDDRDDSLLTLEAVLSNPAYNLIRAQSGIEAIRLLHHYDVAAIVLDVQMPGLDGFETASIIKTKDRFKYIPIIFITAISKDSEYISRGYAVGAVDYLFKPFDPDILRSKVSVFVELYQQKQKIELQAHELREKERRNRELQLVEVELESLRRYRSLADAVPHIIWRSQVVGLADYFNHSWLSYTGLKPERAMGLGWQQVIFQEDLHKLLETWSSFAAAKTYPTDNFEIEARIRSKNGIYRWNLIRIVAERKRNLEVAGWIGTATDIHDRKMNYSTAIKISDRLLNLSSKEVKIGIEESLADLGKLMELDKVALWILSDRHSIDGDVYEWQLKEASPSPKNKNDLLKQLSPDLLEKLHKDESIKLDKLWAGAKRNLGPNSLSPNSGQDDLRFGIATPLLFRREIIGILELQPPAEYFWSEKKIGFVRVLGEMFISSLERASSDLRLLNQAEALARSNSDLEQFAAIASHDLQEPLRIVSNYVQLIERRYAPQLGSEGKQFVDYTVDAVKRMSMLIRDLLNYSKVRTAEINYELVNTADTLTMVMSNLKQSIDESHAKIAHSNLPTIRADRSQIMQLFQNLISNAIKYRGSNTPDIHIQADRSPEGMHIFSVQDNGQGIEKRFFSKIFQIFQRLNSSPDKTTGTGIGLAIAKKIVERHGGKIWLDSKIGQGTTFYFSLPAREEIIKASAA